MPEVVCIVGKSGSGKTTLIERLLPEFKRRNIRVTVLKHTPHGIDLVEKRKDSQRFLTAGAEEVILTTPKALVHFKPCHDEVPLKEAVLELERDVDLLLVEGYKSNDIFPKIEVKGLTEITPKTVKELADSIEEKFLKGKTAGKKKNKFCLSIWINGKKVGLKGFVQDIISVSLLGMVSTLKGVKKVHTLHLKITNPHRKSKISF